MMTELDTLCGSALNVARASGWAEAAWVNALIGVDAIFGLSVNDQIDRAQAALDSVDSSSDGPAATTVTTFFLTVRGWAAGLVGEYDTGLDRYEQADMSNASFPTVTNTALAVAGIAVCQILSGDPHTALENIKRLDAHRIAWQGGDDPRSLAYLALGDLDQAAFHIRVYSEHAITGRVPFHTGNSLILHAALCAAEGDPDHARYICTQPFFGGGPVMGIYAHHIARALGIAETFLQLKLQSFASTSTEHHQTRQMKLAAVLRAETNRRGWA